MEVLCIVMVFFKTLNLQMVNSKGFSMDIA